jgi:hypothetical protein
MKIKLNSQQDCIQKNLTFYRTSRNKRKFSPDPVVKVTIEKDGKEHEEIVLIPTLSKKEGDELSTSITEILNQKIHEHGKCGNNSKDP